MAYNASMGMLDRIRRAQLDGFKEFVQSMEITAISTRQQIFTNGVLEDPIYMEWVMKNIRTFDDFINLPSDEIESVLLSQDQIISLFAKCVHGISDAEVMAYEKVFPKVMGKFKDELSYIKEVTNAEKESAKYYLVKMTRKLQNEEKIIGFSWKLPPQDVFHTRTYPDGHVKIIFNNGLLAAEGGYFKGKRIGTWKHFYDSGKILAEGDYLEGAKAGVWSFYYGSGAPKARGKFKDDFKHGRWEEWDRSGKKIEVEYNEGAKVD